MYSPFFPLYWTNNSYWPTVHNSYQYLQHEVINLPRDAIMQQLSSHWNKSQHARTHTLSNKRQFLQLRWHHSLHVNPDTVLVVTRDIPHVIPQQYILIVIVSKSNRGQHDNLIHMSRVFPQWLYPTITIQNTKGYPNIIRIYVYTPLNRTGIRPLIFRSSIPFIGISSVHWAGDVEWLVQNTYQKKHLTWFHPTSPLENRPSGQKYADYIRCGIEFLVVGARITRWGKVGSDKIIWWRETNAELVIFFFYYRIDYSFLLLFTSTVVQYCWVWQECSMPVPQGWTYSTQYRQSPASMYRVHGQWPLRIHLARFCNLNSDE